MSDYLLPKHIRHEQAMRRLLRSAGILYDQDEDLVTLMKETRKHLWASSHILLQLSSLT
jgi:hypothetical protein